MSFLQYVVKNFYSTSKARTAGPKPFEQIPGPRPLPIIGNIWRYIPTFGDFDITKMHVNAMKMKKEFGPLVREKVIGDRVVVHAFDPRDMGTIFRNEGRYPTRLSHRALLRYREERPDEYRNGGLFPSNGADWAELRQKFQAPLLRQANMEVYRNSLFDIADEVMKKCEGNDNDNPSDLTPLLYKWALEATGVLALDARLGCINSSEDPNESQNQLIETAAETHNVIMLTENGLPFWKFWNTPVYNKLVKAQDTMAKIVRKYLSEKVPQQVNEETSTVLQQFLALPGDKKDVYTMIMDLFLAGIDTTAYAMTFLLYHLATNPNAQNRLREELCVLEKRGGLPSLKDLETCSYLRACTRESHRLLPVALGTGRVLDCDVVLSGHKVPAGTMVVLHNQVASRDPEQFSNPLEFLPERWLRTSGSGNDATRANHPFAYLPFGYGPRMCIGRRFAERVINVLTYKIVNEFSLKYRHDKPMDCFTRLINVPDQPLKLELKKIQKRSSMTPDEKTFSTADVEYEKVQVVS